MTVSELKKEAAAEEDVQEMFEEEEALPYIPAFLREERKMSGAERGTAYHKAAECMDFSGIRHSSQATERLLRLVEQGKLTKEAAELIRPYELYQFAQTGLCKRIIEAQKAGKLYREQPFVFAKTADEVYEGCGSSQDVLIQGMMDAYFEEDGEWVLLDYKTDRVRSETELLERYRQQLVIYAEALEQMTGKKVRERIIYSFALGKEIAV